MMILDDANLGDREGGLEVVGRVGRRYISHAFHDTDGTHSLIRDWAPVMSALTDLTLSGEHGLIVGDGRSEVQAGVAMGVAVLSRLDPGPHRLRDLHRELGTNDILGDYREPALGRLLQTQEA